MKKAIKIILFVLLVIIAVCFGVYAYYGGFAKIEIRTEKQGGEIVTYKEVVGGYNQAGKVSDEIYYSLLNDFGVETYKGFGTYYDNPKEVEESKLRSDIGCIIELKDSAHVKDIEVKYKIKRIPQDDYVVVEFPYKGIMSVFVGLIRVYPALQKYAEEQGIKPENPVTEIYDVPNGKIIYRVKT